MPKWIEFTDITNPVLQYKTKMYGVDNKETNERIGIIKWDGEFRQYAFFPHDNTVYEKTCLKDISEFLQKLMDERKEQKQASNET